MPPAPAPADAHPEHARGTAMAVAATLVFGTSYPATAVALGSFGAVAIGAWRGVGALVVLGLVLLRRRATLAPHVAGLGRADLGRLLLLGLLGGPVFLVGLNLAIALAGSTVAAFVAGSYSVLTAVIAPVVLRERLTPAALGGFLVALAGIVLLSELDLAGAGAGLLPGLAGSLAYAFYLVLSRRWSAGGRLRGDVVSCAVFATTVAVLLPFVLLTDPASLLPAAPAALAVAAVAWVAIGPGALANLLIQAAVRRIPARRSGAILLGNPVFAAAIGVVVLGERPAPAQFAGAGLVLLGMAISSGIVARPGRGGRGAGAAA